MTWQGKNILAVVPARGGSKSIPRKNLAEIGGISLVGRAAKIALSLSWIDRAILSTDDKAIAKEGTRYGLEVPFMRPTDLSGDKSSSIDMWKHAWLASEVYYGIHFDYSVLLEPTSPLRRLEDVERTIRTLVEGNYDSAVTVSLTPAHYTPHKTLKISNSGKLGFYLPQGAQFSIRQSIPDYFHRNGVCYAVRRDTLIERGTIIEGNCAAVIINRPVINIDEPFDLKLADFLISDL